MSLSKLMLAVWAGSFVLGIVAVAVVLGVVLFARRNSALGYPPPDSAGRKTDPTAGKAVSANANGRCPHCGGELPAALVRGGLGGNESVAAATRWPASRSRSNVALACVALQIMGIVTGVVAALVDIESIVATGALLTPLGLVVAGVCYVGRVRSGLIFGLSVPAMAIACFAAIAGFQWSPAQAQFPVGFAICVFAAAALPLGILTLVTLLRNRNLPTTDRRAATLAGKPAANTPGFAG